MHALDGCAMVVVLGGAVGFSLLPAVLVRMHQQ